MRPFSKCPAALVRLGLAWLIVTAGFSPTPAPARAASDFSVYADALSSGWESWSWNTTVAATNTSPVHGGSRSIAATLNAAWAGLYLGTNTPVSASGYTAVQFWIHGGAVGQALTFKVVDSTGAVHAQGITPQAGAWTQISITLAALGNPAGIAGLQWQDAAGHAPYTFYVDDIAFLAGSTPPPPPPGSNAGPTLSVDATADQHAISPYIYGMNYADENLAADLNLPVRRWGGNSTSRYNYKVEATNTGSDYYFENVPVDVSATDFISQNLRTKTKTLLTMPLIGWVAKRRLDNHPFDCSFPRSRYPNQDSFDYWDDTCGKGQWQGVDLPGAIPTDTSIAITESFASEWVNALVGAHGLASQGGVMFYDLDNEPMLWNSTHRDVHPLPTTYDEILSRTVAYAGAIKAADPSAQTLGPVVWGWCAYFYSAKDGCTAGGDRAAHGNLDFIPWYLQQLQAAEAQQGRLLDYLDVHIYPQVDGVYSDNLGDANLQAMRLRLTRQLWDSSYTHEGWIGQPVYLIPRMRAWVAGNYPGTKTAITEYNWGALGYLNGALAQADLLGIFGREGLDLATLWGPPSFSQPGAYAFRMYLNYDGAHSHFGETSVRAASTDQDQVAIYAAHRAQDGALTLMIINKTGASLTSPVNLAHFVPAQTAQVHRYSGANLNAVVRQPDQAVTTAGFTADYPANSITLVIVPPAGTVFLNKTVSPARDVWVGQTITYTLVISGDGRTAQLSDPLPAGLAYVAGSLSAASPPAAYVAASRTITWTGTIPSSGLSLTFQARPAGSPGLAPALYNTATLTDTSTYRAVSASALLNARQSFLPTVLK